MNSSALAAGVRHLRGLMAPHCRHEESDEQLLHAFTTQHDENAFAALVRRHGPLVLGVCRRVLHHAQDAEDVFQATFLLLARNSASLRSKAALGSWLHGAAYRLALTAKRSLARRRKHEGQTASRSPVDPLDELSWKEVRAILDEEIARLPEIYQSVFILCCLENASREEAARRLGLKEGTVSSRLTAARKRLTKRLARRGVELSAVLAVATTALLPAGLMAKTMKCVLTEVSGKELAGLISAPVAQLVQGATAATIVSKARMATVALLAVTLLGGMGVCFLAMPQRQQETLEALTQPRSPLPALRTSEEKHDAAKSVMIHGRVLDPDGKPAAGAEVSIDLQMPNEKRIASAVTETSGRFSITLSRSLLVDPATKFPLRSIYILAKAKGYGLDWLDLLLDDSDKEVTLRLVKDDVPIQGRMLSLEGKPLAGIKVRVKSIEAFPKGDLDCVLDAKRKGNQIVDATEVRLLWYLHHMPDPSLMATTGADGRFRLEGIGRERIATLKVEEPAIHHWFFNVMTRAGEAVRSPYKNDTLYGATLEYMAKPSRLIRGTVREKGTGKPLAGIRVHEIGLTGFISDEVLTDDQGRYELRGCPKGDSYGLSAHADNSEPYLLASIGIKDTPGLGPLTADLEMVRGIPCEGKVLDGETGQLVPGDIGYYPLYPNPNVTSDIGLGNALRGTRVGSYAPFSQAAILADGSFRCAVLPGQGCLVFRARESDRYVLACIDPKTAEVRGDKRALLAMNGEGEMVFGLHQEQFQAIRLIEPAKDTKKVSEIIRVTVARQILGTVLDVDGKPLTGARVRGLARWEWRTLPTERFTVYGVNPQRPRRLNFLHDTRRLIASIDVKGTETKPLTVRLQPWVAVRGRLLDKEGRPLRNARVSGSEFVMENGRTDGEGRFRLEGLVPGLRYEFYYAKGTSAALEILLKDFIGKPGEVRDLGDVRVQPSQPE